MGSAMGGGSTSGQRTLGLCSAVALVLVAAASCNHSSSGSAGGSSAGNLLADAYGFKGPYPSPSAVTYTTSDGTTLTVEAYPGLVQVYVPASVTKDAVVKFAVANSLAIVGQIPALGYYLLSTRAGGENATIGAARTQIGATLAMPDGALGPFGCGVDVSTLEGPNGAFSSAPDLSAQVGDKVNLYVPDCFTSCPFSCGQHGDDTTYLAGQGLAGTPQCLNIGINGKFPHDKDVLASLFAYVDTHPGERTIVNKSYGRDCIGANGKEVNDSCSLPAAALANCETAWLEDVRSKAQLLTSMAATDPVRFSNTVWVQALGNNGLDLTEQIQELHREFPAVFPSDGKDHIVFVGPSELNENTCTGFNHVSQGSNLVVNAPSVQIQVAANGCKSDGTSYAAPEVSNLLARVLSQAPNVDAGTAVKALHAAYMNNQYKLPSVDQVLAELPGGSGSSSGGGSGSSSGGTTGSSSGGSSGGAASVSVTSSSCTMIGTDSLGTPQFTITAQGTAQASPSDFFQIGSPDQQSGLTITIGCDGWTLGSNSLGEPDRCMRDSASEPSTITWTYSSTPWGFGPPQTISMHIAVFDPTQGYVASQDFNVTCN
jgi:hypothetical protein